MASIVDDAPVPAAPRQSDDPTLPPSMSLAGPVCEALDPVLVDQPCVTGQGHSASLPAVHLSDDEFTSICLTWKHSIIIKITGSSIHPSKLFEHLSKLWKLPSFQLTDLPNIFFDVRFTSPGMEEQHRNHVLFNGPWFIGSHCLLVQKWHPFFNPFSLDHCTIIWLRVPSLPVEFFCQTFLSRIGALVGK